MKSNSDNPLAFFEYILDEDNIIHEINSRVMYYGFRWHGINLPYEIRYIEDGEYGDSIEGQIEVKEVLIPLLRIEFEKSKKFVLATYLQNNEVFNKNFLFVQFNTLQSLLVNKSQFINKYPYFLLPIRGLVKHLNDKLLLPEMQQFTLNEDLIEFSPLNESLFIEKSNDEIITSTLSYMKGKNEKQEYILNNEDYLLLVEYTTHLITYEEVPPISKKLAPKLSADVIRFTFWVIHHELYTTKIIKPYFYEFVKAVFIKFKNNEISSIKSQFGTRGRVTRYKFLPEIMKKNLK